MAGILNNRDRVMDSVITFEGRRQLASGKMSIAYVSFTDAATFYEADASSGSSDAGDRLHLEAASMLQDAIAFEADDSGLLQSTPGLFRNGVGVQGGKIVQASDDFLTVVSGSAFASQASSLLRASLDNFRKLRIIGSSGPFDDDIQFVLGTDTLSFDVTDELPISSKKGIARKSIDDVGDLFGDQLLSHVPNFAYLPPVNATLGAISTAAPLGQYKPIGQSSMLTPAQIVAEIDEAAANGYAFDVPFSETSRANNVFAQFFEIRPTDVVKLDVVDYGSFVVPGTSFSRRVFFVGRVYTNSGGASTFLRLFTLMLHDGNQTQGAFA